MVASDYNDNVFVNCPFDAEYQDMFDAIIFAIYKCNFLPRCAKEADDASENRLEKIIGIIRSCRLGIHDLSRTSRNEEGLPRYNMPLELGLFLGAKRYGSREQHQKRILILDSEPYRYQRFISDIAGQDVTSHSDNIRIAVVKVRNWLSSIRSDIPSGSIIWSEYELFQSQLPSICEDLSLVPVELTFSDYIRVVFEWLETREENGI